MKTKLVRILQNVTLIVMLVSVLATFGQLGGAKAASYCSGLPCDEASQCGSQCFCGRGTCYDIQ
jgi:hypothetical protein